MRIALIPVAALLVGCSSTGDAASNSTGDVAALKEACKNLSKSGQAQKEEEDAGYGEGYFPAMKKTREDIDTLYRVVGLGGWKDGDQVKNDAERNKTLVDNACNVEGMDIGEYTFAF